MKERQEKEEVNYKGIIERQMKKENLSKVIVKIMKQQQSLERDAMEKQKCGAVLGIKSRVIAIRQERGRQERYVDE